MSVTIAREIMQLKSKIKNLEQVNDSLVGQRNVAEAAHLAASQRADAYEAVLKNIDDPAARQVLADWEPR